MRPAPWLLKLNPVRKQPRHPRLSRPFRPFFFPFGNSTDVWSEAANKSPRLLSLAWLNSNTCTQPRAPWFYVRSAPGLSVPATNMRCDGRQHGAEMKTDLIGHRLPFSFATIALRMVRCQGVWVFLFRCQQLKLRRQVREAKLDSLCS